MSDAIRMVPAAEFDELVRHNHELAAALAAASASGAKLEKLNRQQINAFSACARLFEMIDKRPGEHNKQFRADTLAAIRETVTNFAACGLGDMTGAWPEATPQPINVTAVMMPAPAATRAKLSLLTSAATIELPRAT
jgi:hypothetical protein